MQEWNAWFRREQSKLGTVEDFARKSGLDVRSIAAYRSDRIPRKATLAKITAVLGDEGPLPKISREQAASYNEQLDELRIRVEQLEDAINSLDEVRLARQVREDAVRFLEAGEGLVREAEDHPDAAGGTSSPE